MPGPAPIPGDVVAEHAQRVDTARLRMWAVEQAAKLHGAQGFTTKSVLTQAEDLIKFVETGEVK